MSLCDATLSDDVATSIGFLDADDGVITNNGPSLPVLKDPFLKNITTLSSFAIPSSTNNKISVVPYMFPFRYDHGKPLSYYSLEVENRRSRHGIANYVSTHILTKQLRAFSYKQFTKYSLYCFSMHYLIHNVVKLHNKT